MECYTCLNWKLQSSLQWLLYSRWKHVIQFQFKTFNEINDNNKNKTPVQNTSYINYLLCLETFKGCVCHIFGSLFSMSIRENLQNKEKCFLFYFESSSRSWDNQILKELRNYILRINRVWSVFCSAQVYISLHFLPVLLVKPGFRLLCFCIFGF